MGDVIETLGGNHLLRAAEGRYPEVDPARIVALKPDILLFPDEPFPFKPPHLEFWREQLPHLPKDRFRICDGRDMCWFGARIPEALQRLAPLPGAPARPLDHARDPAPELDRTSFPEPAPPLPPEDERPRPLRALHVLLGHVHGVHAEGEDPRAALLADDRVGVVRVPARADEQDRPTPGHGACYNGRSSMVTRALDMASAGRRFISVTRRFFPTGRRAFVLAGG